MYVDRSVSDTQYCSRKRPTKEEQNKNDENLVNEHDVEENKSQFFFSVTFNLFYFVSLFSTSSALSFHSSFFVPLIRYFFSRNHIWNFSWWIDCTQWRSCQSKICLIKKMVSVATQIRYNKLKIFFSQIKENIKNKSNWTLQLNTLK